MPDDLSDPIPTKFDKDELKSLDLLKKRTNLSRSEIIRRSVWLLNKEAGKAKDLHAFLGAIGEDRTMGIQKLKEEKNAAGSSISNEK